MTCRRVGVLDYSADGDGFVALQLEYPTHYGAQLAVAEYTFAVYGERCSEPFWDPRCPVHAIWVAWEPDPDDCEFGSFEPVRAGSHGALPAWSMGRRRPYTEWWFAHRSVA